MSTQFHYDTVRYPSSVFAQFRPDTIGAMAILHGVIPDRIANARILEMGCGDGASLLSIAHSMPDAECIGIDLSEQRIAEANSYAREIGISNVEFHHMDVMDLDTDSFGKFDFIIAHGLYSWVPQMVRERVLQVYKECLESNGVGYISYNAYPGWHLRHMLRDAGRFILGGEQGTFENAGRALEFIQLAADCARPESVYGDVLRHELKGLENKAPEVLFHDELADVNQPFYFSEFISQASSAGLDFLAESDPIMHFTGRLGPEANTRLDALSAEPLRREQCLDFLRGTRFRSTLICHPEAAPKYFADPNALDELYFSAACRPEDPEANLLDDSSVEFSTKNGSTFSTNFGFTKFFLDHLGKRYPRPVSFADVTELIRDNFEAAEGDAFEPKMELFRQHIVGLFHAGVVECSCFSPPTGSVVNERPAASAFARWQVRTGFPYVTTPNGQNIKFDSELSNFLLLQVDGTRSIGEMVETLRRSSEWESEKTDRTETDPSSFVNETLEQFCRMGLISA